MLKKGFYLLLFTILTITVMAQDMYQLVSLHYTATPLGDVLRDITRKYDVRFTYSSDFIPLQYPLSTSQKNIPLGIALDELFASTPITYKQIAGQLVLRIDRQKQKMLAQQKQRARQMAKRRKSAKKTVPQLPETGKVFKPEGGDRIVILPPVPKITTKETLVTEEKRPMAQISLFDYASNWKELEGKKEAKVIIDIIGGSHNYVDGLNIGGTFNNTLHDMKGVQIAGLGNVVNGKVKGTQIAGLFNKARGDVSGLQAAGIFNLTKGNTTGIQVAGITNLAHKTSTTQIAGVLNYTDSDANLQIASLLNVAGNVKQSQYSLLFNKAKKVKGYQFALINVADTVSGTSFGLLNIIRRGYNRIELSGNEVFFSNIAGKFGNKHFYNIFHLGARWDAVSIENQRGIYMSWGIGYGFGTTVSLGKKTILNIEAAAIHINELKAWTNKLNLLNQLRFTLDVTLGKRISLFAGPVLNVKVSAIKDDPGEQHIPFVPYTFLDQSNENNNIKMWVGFTAGIRF